MGDEAIQLKITRSQLLDDARKLSRVQMVSDRIYRNHLKTRFFNLQEQRKLGNTIGELEKLEKDSWRELNHRKLGLERRAAKLSERIAINRVAACPSVTLRSAGRRPDPATTPRYEGDAPHRSRPRVKSQQHPHGPVPQLQAPKIWGVDRRPSFSSLLNPYMTNDTEYSVKLGYAQHMTTKGCRKSSTFGSPLGLEELQQYYYNKPHFSESQEVIFRGLKQTAKGLIKMGVITKDSQRRISGLPTPATFEEDKARYIRVPGFQEEGGGGGGGGGGVTYQDLAYPFGRRRSSMVSAPDPNRLGPGNRLTYRRGSRSMGELEMKRYLPYVGKCPTPVLGLNNDFSDKLTLFNKHMDELQHRDSLDRLPRTPVDYTAPPPRDQYHILEVEDQGSLQIETIDMVESAKGDEIPLVVAGSGERVRMSVVDRFGLSKWRKDMAVHDTLPVIRACKYIRNPSRERYDPQSNQYYEIEEEEEEEEDDDDDDVSAPLPDIPGTRLYNVVQEAVQYSRDMEDHVSHTPLRYHDNTVI